MRVLLTGAHGTVGTALTTHLGDDYDFTLFDRREVDDETDTHPHSDHEAVVGDVGDGEAVADAVKGHDAVVHLAGYPRTDGTWETVLENNVVGTRIVLDAAERFDVDTVVFASSNHAVGMYEVDNAPDIYDGTVFTGDDRIDHTVPFRPDSPYGSSKATGEVFGREFAERDAFRFYAIRICSVREPRYDHPYGDAEHGVDEGRWDRGSDAYENAVARMKAMWQSRRDCAHLFDCCLSDSGLTYDVFYGVSDNERRWFDIDHARDIVGYDPQDDGEEWRAPPDDHVGS